MEPFRSGHGAMRVGTAERFPRWRGMFSTRFFREGGPLVRLAIPIAAVLIAATAVQAGNIDYISSRSADFLRIMSRNASTEGADLVSFNPAGLSLLPEGWHFNVSTQTLLRRYTVEATPPGASAPAEYESTAPTPILPNVYVVYRKGIVAAFAAFTAPAGDRVDFADGLRALPLIESAFHDDSYIVSMNSGFFRSTSRYLAGSAGLSVALTDDLSAALGLRYTMAERTLDAEGNFTISSDLGIPVDTLSRGLHARKTAYGFGAVVGLNYRISPAVNAAVRYETDTSLDFKTDSERSEWAHTPWLWPEVFENRSRQRRDLPAVLGAGIEVLSPCRRALVSLSMNCYFLENANQSECDSYDDNYGNGMDLGLGVRYTATPRLDLSAGYQYSDLGGSDTTYNDLEFSLDSHFIGAGARYEVSPGLDLTGSVAKLFCTEGEGAGRFGGSIYNKDIWYFGLGAGLSLPSD